MRHIPVHFISAADRPIEALSMGAIGFLTKPVSPEDRRAFGRIESLIAKPVKSPGGGRRPGPAAGHQPADRGTGM